MLRYVYSSCDIYTTANVSISANIIGRWWTFWQSFFLASLAFCFVSAENGPEGLAHARQSLYRRWSSSWKSTRRYCPLDSQPVVQKIPIFLKKNFPALVSKVSPHLFNVCLFTKDSQRVLQSRHWTGYTVLNETLTVTACMELSRINSMTRKIDEIALLNSDKGIFEGGNWKWLIKIWIS